MASLLSCTPQRLPASQQRLKDIQNALAGRPIASEGQPSQSQPPRSQTGRAERLRLIEEVLSGSQVSSGATVSSSQLRRSASCAPEPPTKPPQLSQDWPNSSQPPRSQAGRAERLRLIEEALSGSQVPSETTQMNVSPIQVTASKRRASCAPESPPPAKRRQLSPDWSSPSPTPPLTHTPMCTSPFWSSQDSLTTTKPVDASPSPVPVVTSPPEKIPRRLSARSMLPSNVDSCLEKFFKKYPRFRFDPSKPATAQFHSLCDSQKWKRNDKQRRSAAKDFGDALTQSFNNIYGTEVDDIRSWQTICAVIEIHPIPDNLEDCQNAVLSAHVNIVDLVDTTRTGKPVYKFASERKLSEYTKKTNRFFPLQTAYTSGLLRFLLRRILDPPPDDA